MHTSIGHYFCEKKFQIVLFTKKGLVALKNNGKNGHFFTLFDTKSDKTPLFSRTSDNRIEI